MDNWRKVTLIESGSVAMLDLLKPGTFVILVPDRSIGAYRRATGPRTYPQDGFQV